MVKSTPFLGGVNSRCSWTSDCRIGAYVTFEIKSQKNSPDLTEINNKIYIIDPKTGKIIQSFQKTLGGYCRKATISKDGKYVGAASPNTACIWDVKTGKLICELGSEKGATRQLFFSSNNETCVSVTAQYVDGGGSNTVTIHKLLTGANEATFKTTTVKKVMFTSDNKIMIIALNNGDVSFRNLETNEILTNIPSRRNRFCDIEILPKNKRLTLDCSNEKKDDNKRSSYENVELNFWKIR